MTTKDEISQWFDRGTQRGAAFMLVICDTYDWEDYPTYASNEAEARQKTRAPGEMQKVMEVYDLNADKAAQLSIRRNWALRA